VAVVGRSEAVSERLAAEAARLIPGGVSSPVRAMRSVGRDHPLFLARGEGPYVDDVDGNRYIDWVMSWGPLIAGHAQPDVVAAVTAAAAAGTSFVIFWTATGDSYREILNWLLGSLAGATWGSVAIAGVAVLVVGAVLILSSTRLDAFAFGDTSAAALGIDVNRTRWTLMTVVALLTGAMVAVSGAIGFVGLILPHAVSSLTGPAHRRLLPVAALSGAVFLVWADTLARTLFDPRELPVGIVTALIGVPVFAYLLRRGKGTAWT